MFNRIVSYLAVCFLSLSLFLMREHTQTHTHMCARTPTHPRTLSPILSLSLSYTNILKSNIYTNTLSLSHGYFLSLSCLLWIFLLLSNKLTVSSFLSLSLPLRSCDAICGCFQHGFKAFSRRLSSGSNSNYNSYNNGSSNAVYNNGGSSSSRGVASNRHLDQTIERKVDEDRNIKGRMKNAESSDRSSK